MIGFPKIIIAICGVLIITFTVCDGIMKSKADAAKDAENKLLLQENIDLTKKVKEFGEVADRNRREESIIARKPDLRIEVVNISLYTVRADRPKNYTDSHIVVIKNYGTSTAENVVVKINTFREDKDGYYSETLRPIEIPPGITKAFPLTVSGGGSNFDFSPENINKLRDQEMKRDLVMRCRISYVWEGEIILVQYKMSRNFPSKIISYQKEK